MDSYFQSHYSQINIFGETKDKIRNGQYGAIMAIGSHFSTSKQPALISMPTGTGKSAVIMLSPYLLKSTKVLIITPTILVRSQMADDFKVLRTLTDIGVFPEIMHKPKIFEMSTKFKESMITDIEKNDVVIATPICALSLSEHEIKQRFDIIIIDEAHHEPAKTWKSVLKNMQFCNQLLFTATPFRRDDKRIEADYIYNYPLSLAYKDGIYSNVEYIPVEENNEDDDKNLAKTAEEIFLRDKDQGYNHLIMVRTNSIHNAKSLKEIYDKNTELSLEVIDSSKSRLHVNSIIQKLKDKELDGVICVDMMAEGFDFPNLKIAAIHHPHRSLASTLQFIGRFTRTNSDNLGHATFIAINNEELLIENINLYKADAIWNDIIINLSEEKIDDEISSHHFIRNFESNDDLENEFHLHSIHTNYHAKIFRTPNFNIEASLNISGYNLFKNYTYDEINTSVFIFQKHDKPRWTNSDSNIFNTNYECVIVYYDKINKFLFINSSIKSEQLYKYISNQFCGENIAKKLRLKEIHKVLAGYSNFEFFNAGLSNNKGNGESYKISSGSDVSTTFNETTGELYSPGHIYCKVQENDMSETIGYSSGSKIWSSTYGGIKELVEWFSKNSKKLSLNEDILTKTSYDYLPIPEYLENYPDNIFMCELNQKTYERNHNLSTHSSYNITDISLNISNVSDNYIEILVQFDDLEYKVTVDIEGSYSSHENFQEIKIRVAHQELTLVEYFNEFPLSFYTSDLRKISQEQITQKVESITPYYKDNIIPVNWEEYNTNIKKEFFTEKEKLNTNQLSIHDTLKIYLLNKNNDYDYIFYDHGTGEMADYITLKKKTNLIEVQLIHVKSASSLTSKNNNVGDIYEVSGQCIKSINWIKNTYILEEKINDRRKKNYCKLIDGDLSNLNKYLSENIPIRGKLVACQPSLTNSIEIPNKIGELLSAVDIKVKNSLTTNSFEVWGS